MCIDLHNKRRYLIDVAIAYNTLISSHKLPIVIAILSKMKCTSKSATGISMIPLQSTHTYLLSLAHRSIMHLVPTYYPGSCTYINYSSQYLIPTNRHTVHSFPRQTDDIYSPLSVTFSQVFHFENSL